MFYNITASSLKEKIGTVKIIDIRENYLYRMGYIPTAINVPSNFLLINPKEYMNKDNTYYLYCNMGIKSVEVCKKLTNMGYKVINVLGGYNGYLSK